MWCFFFLSLLLISSSDFWAYEKGYHLDSFIFLHFLEKQTHFPSSSFLPSWGVHFVPSLLLLGFFFPNRLIFPRYLFKAMARSLMRHLAACIELCNDVIVVDIYHLIQYDIFKSHLALPGPLQAMVLVGLQSKMPPRRTLLCTSRLQQ